LLLVVVGLARLALEALLGPAEVCSHQAVRQVVLRQEGCPVLLALRDPVVLGLADLQLALDVVDVNLVPSAAACDCPEPDELRFRRIVHLGSEFGQVGLVVSPVVFENRAFVGCEHACVREGAPLPYGRC